MRCPARLRHAREFPGGFGSPPSATTSGRHMRVHARLLRATELADGEAFLLHPARDRNHKSRGGAPRGERPTSLDARRLVEARSRASSTRYAPAGLRYWPAEGCRSTRAPVGAPLPSLCVRGHCKARRTFASRERFVVPKPPLYVEPLLCGLIHPSRTGTVTTPPASGGAPAFERTHKTKAPPVRAALSYLQRAWRGLLHQLDHLAGLVLALRAVLADRAQQRRVRHGVDDGVA